MKGKEGGGDKKALYTLFVSVKSRFISYIHKQTNIRL